MAFRSLLSILLASGWSLTAIEAKDIYVSPAGNDSAAGALESPVATLARAQELVRTAAGKEPVNVYVREGTYYLTAPLVFTSADSGTKDAPVVYQAYEQEKPVISGGVKLTGLNWQPYKDGILQTPVPADLATDQLFVNGEKQILARYPNYDPKAPVYNGCSADCTSPEHMAKWADPTGGFVHAIHQAGWGSYDYVIKGKTPDGKVIFEGGWQHARRNTKETQFIEVIKGAHPEQRFVENIFEELDAPGEWYLNTKTHTLYFYPPAGLDLSKATVEAARLKNLVDYEGSDKTPVVFITLKGFTFRHALRTFMETNEVIMRSDWAIYRGGAIFLNGTEDCSIEDSTMEDLGGNAIFVSNYARRDTVRGCHIHDIGANGVSFLGDPKCTRMFSPHMTYDALDKTPGPKTDNYPSDCLVDDCLIHSTGQIEKQSSPVEIDIAADITVRHCSIYDCPRAGINIGDGCWGGDVIEYCDTFNTVLETHDNGAFNSWGRDRYWNKNLKGVHEGQGMPDLPRLDTIKPIILRNSRWRCDNGWDIDLDDGASNYIITNNLCLSHGLKLHDGYDRDAENNITVNNFLHVHMWAPDSHNIIAHDIVWKTYVTLRMTKPWGQEVDYNFLQKNGADGTQSATALQAVSGHDEHSLTGDAQFIDPAHGDYRVKDGSPVLALGFKNFPMDQFGVQKPELKAIARTPDLSPVIRPGSQDISRPAEPMNWLGAKVRNIKDEGEMSAYALPGITGVLVMHTDSDGVLAKAKIYPDDVIVAVGSKQIVQTADLPQEATSIQVIRNQKQIMVKLP